jgi:hypothetical protein
MMFKTFIPLLLATTSLAGCRWGRTMCGRTLLALRPRRSSGPKMLPSRAKPRSTSGRNYMTIPY